jgi:hypothetical protein
MLIVAFTLLVAVAVCAIGAAYHYKWESQFNLELLNDSNTTYLTVVDTLSAHNVKMAEQVADLALENDVLKHDLGQYIAANLFDAWTIRNMTVSIEGLSSQIDGLLIEHAKLVLGAQEIIDDCTCEPGEAPCKDTACTCVHHKWNSLPLDQV